MSSRHLCRSIAMQSLYEWDFYDQEEPLEKDDRRERLKKLRKKYNVAYKCPRCDKILNKDQDIKFYKMVGMCLGCKVNEDTQMKIDGTFDEYQYNFMYNNLMAFLENAERDVVDVQNLLADAQYVNQDGTIEKWDLPYTTEEMQEKIKNDFESLKNDLLKRYKEYLQEIGKNKE